MDEASQTPPPQQLCHLFPMPLDSCRKPRYSFVLLFWVSWEETPGEGNRETGHIKFLSKKTPLLSRTFNGPCQQGQNSETAQWIPMPVLIYFWEKETCCMRKHRSTLIFSLFENTCHLQAANTIKEQKTNQKSGPKTRNQTSFICSLTYLVHNSFSSFFIFLMNFHS